MDSSGLHEMVTPSALISTALLLCLGFILRYYLLPQKISLPLAKIEEGETTTEALMRSVVQFSSSPFILPLKSPWVILPHSLVDEVKDLPEDSASFTKLSYKRMHGRYTGVLDGEHPEGIAAIRNDLTRNIAGILSGLQDEISFAFDKELGDFQDWKETPVHGIVLKLVARLSARTFVGLPLCRDDEWLSATINLTTDTVQGVNAIAKCNPWIRPFVAPFLREIKNIQKYNRFFTKKLEPQIKAIMSAHERQGHSKMKPSAEEISDDEVIEGSHNLVHWVIFNFKDPKQATPYEIGQVEKGAAFAAIHTTSMAISHAMFALAAYPQYADVLREEFSAIIAEEDYSDKRLRKTSMPKLKKMDSFIKESQRVNPPGMIAMGRLVTAKEGLILSTGHKIPTGSQIGFPNTFYPTAKVYPDIVVTEKSQPPLSEFYPWRFSEIRSRHGEENKHQFVSADKNNISFGTGVHACPGRFFASNEIKVVLVEMLKRYDLALGPQGQVEGQEGFTMPKMLEIDTFYAPNPYAKIYLKQRK